MKFLHSCHSNQSSFHLLRPRLHLTLAINTPLSILVSVTAPFSRNHLHCFTDIYLSTLVITAFGMSSYHKDCKSLRRFYILDFSFTISVPTLVYTVLTLAAHIPTLVYTNVLRNTSWWSSPIPHPHYIYGLPLDRERTATFFPWARTAVSCNKYPSGFLSHIAEMGFRSDL